MMLIDINGKQLSPCIAAKGRYALGLKNRKPHNNKTCSKEYWIKTINALLQNDPNYEHKRRSAIDKYSFIIKNN